MYWSGSGYAPNPYHAWHFGTDTGYQDNFEKTEVRFYAWADHPGNVAAAVPEPGVFWLLGTGLAGWLGLKRRGNIG